MTLQQEQSSGVGSIPGRVAPIEHHDNGSRIISNHQDYKDYKDYEVKDYRPV